MSDARQSEVAVSDAEVEAVYEVLGGDLVYGLTVDACSQAEMDDGPDDARDMIRRALEAAKGTA